MSETYCVRLPLEFPGGYRIDELDPPAIAEILGHAVELSAKDGNYALTVKGIESEDAARAFLRKLHVGIWWAGLELKTGIRASPEPQKITYSDDPDKAGKKLMLQRPVDVVIDTAYPAIFREDARIARLSAGSVSIIKSIKPERFFAALREGLEQARPEVFACGAEVRERIESAIELYALSHFEPNIVPRFLLQCTALEVLAPARDSEPAHIVAKVDAWMSAAHACAGQRGTSESEQEDLKRLAQKAGQLKSLSHRERIRRFARQALGRARPGDLEDKIKRLIDAYDARGRFLHEGDRNKIESAASDMNDTLPILLKAVLNSRSDSAG